MILAPVYARLACNVLAYLYPAYKTYYAVRSGDREEHAQWLTYWIASSYFTVFELFGDQLLSWLPLYFEVKVALLIWLVTPRFRGAEKIYKQVIHPYLVRYESDIDQSIASIREHGVEQLGALRDAGVRHVRTSSNELFGKMAQQAVLSGFLHAAAGTPQQQQQQPHVVQEVD